MNSPATFSPCRTWRYDLVRELKALAQNPNRPTCTVVMLNPSTADESIDDPTIRRVRGFAAGWGYGRIRVMNLFALRATDPAELYTAADPIGPDNDRHLRKALAEAVEQCEPVLAAWGTHGRLRGRGFTVLRMVPEVCWRALGVNKDATPKHPLYVSAHAKAVLLRVEAHA